MQEEINFEGAKFFGPGYDPEQDAERLKGQLKAVYQCMTHDRAVKWWTLAGISESTGVPEASVSAGLRTLRNQYGFIVDRKRAREGCGLHLYQIKGRDPSLVNKKKKMKPVGDPKLWGEMMRCIYAYAKKDWPDDTHLQADALDAAEAWMDDMANRINQGKIEVTPCQ